MAMAAGQKITPPFVRASSTHGRIHAVVTTETAPTRETVCGRTVLAPDEPQKRFQVGLAENCGWCEKKVVEFRQFRANKGKTTVVDLVEKVEAG